MVLIVLKRIRFENLTVTNSRRLGNMGILGFADLGDRAVAGLGLQLLDGWDRGFESRWGMDVRLLCLLNVV
jgi:hypothetical protein